MLVKKKVTPDVMVLIVKTFSILDARFLVVTLDPLIDLTSYKELYQRFVLKPLNAGCDNLKVHSWRSAVQVSGLVASDWESKNKIVVQKAIEIGTLMEGAVYKLSQKGKRVSE